jgi:tetratricopeptide (TPR) repeat protein
LLTTIQKKHAQRRRILYLIVLLAISAMAGGWWLWQNKIAVAARFSYLTVSVNEDVRKLLSGETLSLHPNDRIRILSISTSIPFNLNIRLSAKGFDVNALRYETLPLTELLPQQDPFDRYRFVIHVKHYNQDLGEVVWVVQPYAEDWLEKANRIIDPERRIEILERGRDLTSQDKAIARRLIHEYTATRKWAKAAAMLEEMAKTQEDLATLTDLLSVYREMNDTAGTLRVLRRIIALNPNDVAARKAYAEALEKKEDWNGAIGEYEALLGLLKEGERLDTYKRLGYLYTLTQDYPRAIEVYLQAAKLDQRDANLHYNLSYLYEKTGQQEKADFYLDNAVTLKADDVEGRLRLAHHLVERGETTRAREQLTEVLHQNPDHMTALALLAKVLEEGGDKNTLRSVYQKILALDPTDDTVRYNLGALEYETGNFKEALSYFETYSTSHPEDAEIHGILFDIYKRENDFSNAFEEALALVALRPNEPDVYDFIVEYLRQKGDIDALIPILEKGVKANPDAIRIRKYLASAYAETGRDEQAIDQVDALLAAKAEDMGALLHELFERLRSQKAYGRIIDLMKRAAAAYPQDAGIKGYLVFAYLETGKEAAAMDEMAAILKLRPKDVDLWLQLARLREKTGHLAGAARAYQRVLALAPDHAGASEAYLRLRLKGVGLGDEED